MAGHSGNVINVDCPCHVFPASTAHQSVWSQQRITEFALPTLVLIDNLSKDCRLRSSRYVPQCAWQTGRDRTGSTATI